jgi:hypothetical protein
VFASEMLVCIVCAGHEDGMRKSEKVRILTSAMSFLVRSI